MKHVKLKSISLKRHPTLNERWVQDIIAADPLILGIGDVILKDKERRQAGAGRLDLLLQDNDGHGRYEVEIQLGNVDEQHIIRTIEYWDLERKKYPMYDHTAVIVAEDITSRFLNVISLFNGHIPIMALKLSAIETENGVGLHFTKVLDTVKLGFVDEDETTNEQVDRSYWETQRGTKTTVKLTDDILEMTKSFAPTADLSYNKHYIGFWVDGRALNFAIMRPQRSAVRLEIGLPRTTETDSLIENTDLDFLDYDARWKKYRLKLTKKDLDTNRELILELMKTAYDLRA